MKGKKKMRRKVYDFGSISCGTTLAEDLIPVFIEELEGLARANGPRRNKRYLDFVREVSDRMDTEEYFQSDQAGYDLDTLIDMLNDFAAPKYYFGAHLGDGADYGFWRVDDM